MGRFDDETELRNDGYLEKPMGLKEFADVFFIYFRMGTIRVYSADGNGVEERY